MLQKKEYQQQQRYQQQQKDTNNTDKIKCYKRRNTNKVKHRQNLMLQNKEYQQQQKKPSRKSKIPVKPK